MSKLSSWINYIKFLLLARKPKNQVEQALGIESPKMGFFQSIIYYIKLVFNYRKYYVKLEKHPRLNKFLTKFLKKQNQEK